MIKIHNNSLSLLHEVVIRDLNAILDRHNVRLVDVGGYDFAQLALDNGAEVAHLLNQGSYAEGMSPWTVGVYTAANSSHPSEKAWAQPIADELNAVLTRAGLTIDAVQDSEDIDIGIYETGTSPQWGHGGYTQLALDSALQTA